MSKPKPSKDHGTPRYQRRKTVTVVGVEIFGDLAMTLMVEKRGRKREPLFGCFPVVQEFKFPCKFDVTDWPDVKPC